MVNRGLKRDIPVHWLSKEARFRIIDVLLSTRTVKNLAEELKISRAAIRKYVSRETHPSDDIMARIFEIIAPYEEDRLARIVVDDLVEAIKRLNNSLEREEHKSYLMNKLKEVLKELEGR